MIGLKSDGELDVQLGGEGDNGRQGAAGKHDAATRVLQLVETHPGVETPEVQVDYFDEGGVVPAFFDPTGASSFLSCLVIIWNENYILKISVMNSKR